MPHVWIFGMGIPQPGPGDIYEVWLGRTGEYTPAGQFTPGPDGYVQAFVPADLSGYDEVMITEEPASTTATQPLGAVRWIATIVP